jgi:Domain of unknown function (DUF4136)
MSRFRATLPAALVLLAACGPTVTVDVSPEAAVPGGGTYAWGGQQIKLPSEVQQGIVARSPAIQAMVRKAIDAELQKKGYRVVDSTQAAFFVRYAVGSRVRVENVTEISAIAPGVAGCGEWACWNGWDTGWYDASQKDVSSREAGIVIDLVDRSSGKLAWRSVLRDDAPDKIPDEKLVHSVVAKALKKLPATKS